MATFGGVAFGTTTNVDCASASTAPSLETMLALISDLPFTAPGNMILRLGSVERGMAHAPGAME
jgi:hypothetical protein